MIMKNILIVILCVIFAAFAGLYTRPSYILVGQLDWMDVITKGYFLSTIPKFFTQGMIDESFYWVLKFSGAGLVLGVLVTLLSSGGKTPKSKKKKA